MGRIGDSMPGLAVAASTVLAAVVLPAVAQGNRPWVDPPPRPAPASPAGGPGQAAPEAPAEQRPAGPASRIPTGPAPPVPAANRSPAAGAGDLATASLQKSPEYAARQLAVDYLDFWSAPNALTLETMPGFYAPRVNFHGREMSARALFDAKSRFVRRWPIRSYTPRSESTRIACEPQSRVCTVNALFDFIAIDPDRRRRSEGMATLELEISTAGARPLIVSEHSRILRRGRMKREAGRPDPDDDASGPQ